MIQVPLAFIRSYVRPSGNGQLAREYHPYVQCVENGETAIAVNVSSLGVLYGLRLSDARLYLDDQQGVSFRELSVAVDVTPSEGGD